MTRLWSTWLLIVPLLIGAANMHAFAVSMETDKRIAPEDGGRGNDGVKARMGAQYGATGLVRCGGAVGTAQLTLRSDIITTAAHVLIGADGQPRASCSFQSAGGGAAVAIDPASIKAGSRSPLSEPATRDWAGRSAQAADCECGTLWVGARGQQARRRVHVRGRQQACGANGRGAMQCARHARRFAAGRA